MKKILLLSAFILIGVSICAKENNFYGKIAIDFTGEYEIKRDGFTDKTEVETGFAISFEATKNLNEQLELGLGIAFEKHGDIKEVPESSISSIPTYGVVRYNFNTINGYQPFVKGYLGYSINDGNIQEVGYHTTVSAEMKNGLYYGIGIGVEYNNFVIELSYSENKGDAEVIITDFSRISTEMEMNYSKTMLGFGYKF